MATTVILREVKPCNCMEHQAADRYREIIRGLKQRIEVQQGMIDEFADDLGYTRRKDSSDDLLGIGSFGTSSLPSPQQKKS